MDVGPSPAAGRLELAWTMLRAWPFGPQRKCSGHGNDWQYIGPVQALAEHPILQVPTAVSSCLSSLGMHVISAEPHRQAAPGCLGASASSSRQRETG